MSEAAYTPNIAKVFKNYVPNSKVVTPEGRIILFIGGKHITQIKKDIEYLTDLVEAGDKYVYIDPNEAEVDTEELTVEGRTAKIKREAIAEYLAQQARAAEHNSTSEQGELGAGTSSTLVNSLASNSGMKAASQNEGGKVAATETVATVTPVEPSASGVKVNLPASK